MIAAARLAAYAVARSIRGEGVDAATAIARAQSSLSDPRDRALMADIALGVERWRAALDFRLTLASARPLEKLDDQVLDILRLSAYQLLHLTRVPAAAIVADAVDMTRRVGKGSAAGFVNAVLRGVSRQRDRETPLPPRPAFAMHVGQPLAPDSNDRETPEAPSISIRTSNREHCLDYLSITLSHPRWLAARWLDRLGFDTAEHWMRHGNTPGPLVLRANPLKMPPEGLVAVLGARGVTVTRGRFAPGAFVVDSGRPLTDPGVDAGWFVPQDEASQIVALLAGASPGARILDTCAAPGGKTTAIAAASPTSRVVACDVRARRMRVLAQTVRATGATNVHLVQADATLTLPFNASFDCVIVDAPCSGLGVLRRDPDIRWKRREEDLRSFAAAQLRMLRHASDVVRPGGRLVYATCSTEPEENEEVVDAFLRHAQDFSPLDARLAHPQIPPATVDEKGHIRTAPHTHGLDGFFGAVLLRRA
jgi:16S rRNA (cytosine967-C5)-methyltransferase